MKIVCEVIGGPFAGTYEDDNWPNTEAFPIKPFASASSNFTVGGRFKTVHPFGKDETARTRSQPKDDRIHNYEVVSHEENAGVVRVRVDYQGSGEPPPQPRRR